MLSKSKGNALRLDFGCFPKTFERKENDAMYRFPKTICYLSFNALLYWSPMPLQEIFIHSGDVARVGSDSEFGGRRSPWPKTRWNYRRFVILNNSKLHKLPSGTWCTKLSKHLQHPSISWNLYDTFVLLSLMGWTSPWNFNFCWFRDFVTLPKANSSPLNLGRAPKTSFPTTLFLEAMSVSSGRVCRWIFRWNSGTLKIPSDWLRASWSLKWKKNILGVDWPFRVSYCYSYILLMVQQSGKLTVLRER